MDTAPACVRGLFAPTVAAVGAGAEAAIFRDGPGCTDASVQAAVNAAPSTGTHAVHITNAVEFTAQAIVIDGRKPALRGGDETARMRCRAARRPAWAARVAPATAWPSRRTPRPAR